MSKKGVGAPTWQEALINPKILESHRLLQIKEYSLQVKRLLALEQAALQGTHKTRRHDLFSLKQLSGHYLCDITPENFTKGQEKEWIRVIKSLDNEDPDPSHLYQEHIRREIQKIKPTQVKNSIDKLSIEDTKDEQAHAQREIDKTFPEYLLHSLDNSPSQSLIIQLVNSKNEKEPLALVRLKGQNGLWMHDPKLGVTFDFNHTNVTGFKQFLMEHIKVNHPESNKAFIIQLGNKEKARLSHKEIPKDAKHLFQERKIQIQPQLTKPRSQQEEPNKEEDKKPTKPRL